MKVGIVFFAIGVLLINEVRAGNWYARCQTSDGLCQAERCGISSADANDRCQAVCPGSDTIDISQSNCSIPGTGGNSNVGGQGGPELSVVEWCSTDPIPSGALVAGGITLGTKGDGTERDACITAPADWKKVKVWCRVATDRIGEQICPGINTSVACGDISFVDRRLPYIGGDEPRAVAVQVGS